MAQFLQDRSCNDDFVPLYQNSNSNNMDVQEPSIETDTNELNDKKRKRENTEFYAFAKALVNEGEINVNEAELDTDYVDYAYAGGGINYDYNYDYDEDAMIQDEQHSGNNGYISQDDEEECQDEDLFQIKHQISGQDMSMDLSDSEEDEINADFDELQRLRDELTLLRAESEQRRIAFPEGSQIRFIMVDGVRYLQVFQESHSKPMSIDDLNCDSEEEKEDEDDDYNDF